MLYLRVFSWNWSWVRTSQTYLQVFLKLQKITQSASDVRCGLIYFILAITVWKRHVFVPPTMKAYTVALQRCNCGIWKFKIFWIFSETDNALGLIVTPQFFIGKYLVITHLSSIYYKYNVTKLNKKLYFII